MKLLMVLLIVSLLLTACAGAGKAVPAEDLTATLPAVTPQVEAPELTVPVREIAPDAEAVQLAADQLGIPATDLTLVEAEAVDWPDASLGCPQPGMTYATVVTPGWRFTFTDKEGITVTLHTDRDLQSAALCESQGKQRATSTTAADQVRDLLASQLRVAPETLTLISVNEMEWADASLGCPKPDMMYAQVITPGYQYIFADQSGRKYDVHTGKSPASFVLCEPKLPAPPSSQLPPTNAATQRAIEWLAEREGVTKDQISVTLVEAVDWPDSCLGCKEPGIYCLTVIVPGYRVTLRIGETSYEVRTDRGGVNCAICKNP